MRAEILGSGGSFTIPKPGRKCLVCNKARKNGHPFVRTGPSVFIHGPNVLIDTPEESKEQLNRSAITKINGCFYSHWHGDHVLGYRVWWSRNYDFKRVNPKHRRTPIYLPSQVAIDLDNKLGIWDRLVSLEKQGLIKLVIVKDGKSVYISGVEIKPFNLFEEGIYGFLFSENAQRILIVMDDTFNQHPCKELVGTDLAILPMGVAEFNPMTGKRRMGKNHPVLIDEATFEDTLSLIKRLRAKRTVLMHIEEHDGLSYDDLKVLSKKLEGRGLKVQFAFDSMVIEI